MDVLVPLRKRRTGAGDGALALALYVLLSDSAHEFMQ